MMHFIYALINFALLVAILWLFGRKMVASIFSSRREKLIKALDEAEALEAEAGTYADTASVDAAEETHDTEAGAAAKAEIRSIEETAERDCAAVSAQIEREKHDLHREMLSHARVRFVDDLVVHVRELFQKEPYVSDMRAKEADFIDRILEKIKLTPGDASYLKHTGVLYVTLASAHPLDPALAQKVECAARALLAPNGGECSFRTKTDPALIGGVSLRIGDTVYDCTVTDLLYRLERALKKREVCGEEDTQQLLADLKGEISRMNVSVSEYQRGRVISVSDGICWLDGLSDIMYGEVVEFACGERGMVLDIETDRIGCVIYGRYEHIESGSRVRRVGRIASVPVGKEMLGRVVDPLGHPMDGGGRIWTTERRPIEFAAPSIPDRASVSRPMHTGLKAIDAMVPIGRGQRELIIGDRQTGKTAIAIDTIINQKGKDVVCIYVAIGQKDSTVAEIYEKLRKCGAMAYTTIVCAPAAASASMQYIAPFAGAAMGEYFMYGGKDVLIVYDDLSKHAVAYRELSLLLHRPSGREAYPGDVFYLHARLLERAAQLSPACGGGSMTALPIIETQASDISAYIPTNVISITDGQIFLETDLFNEGQRPAVNVGLSVSRVGSAAQTKVMKQVSSRLRMNLAQYRELVGFSQFGSDLDTSTKMVLDAGAHMMAALRQGRYAPLEDWKQVLLIFAVSEGFAAGVAPEQMEAYESALYEQFEAAHPELVECLKRGDKMTPETTEALKAALSEGVKLPDAHEVAEYGRTA